MNKTDDQQFQGNQLQKSTGGEMRDEFFLTDELWQILDTDLICLPLTWLSERPYSTDDLIMQNERRYIDDAE